MRVQTLKKKNLVECDLLRDFATELRLELSKRMRRYLDTSRERHRGE